MSHLLHNPYNKPSPFDLPPAVQPLTPPDTDAEFAGQSFRSAPVHGTDALDSDPAVPQTSAFETSTPFFRRQPSVSYIHSGPRDFRERGPQRSLIKWLVVVIPPASFSREHGHLGHTLSSGSSNRLSQGILMPLFPTMNNQLGAIAREFSFPSTAGLCLYLHTNQNGISLYPRITDESWQLLWAHLFDVRGHGMQQPQLPISGQIEFDIDFSKARWYDSWVASPRKDFADVPQSVAGHSRRPSLTHWRGDSRTTFLDDQVDEPIPLDSITIVQQPKAPRMVPRKLSLLDKFDTPSVVSTTKAPRDDSPQSPLSEAQYRVLSPIAQEEEPKTARKDVNNYVSAWRASAKVSPSPLAATGQTSLDAANLPNILSDIPIAESGDDTSELNLDDYAWSVSSLGPADYDIEDGYDSESWRLPSPDIAGRQLSDAPPTPTTATSWGAPLSYPPSPVYAYSDYAPSVDLAGRVEFSRPVTPATATSWGPPSYPTSPVYASSDHAPSVDLAHRAAYSRPVTPMTATSWGAPSLPVSPMSARSGYAPSVDLGARVMSSCPATPSTATSWGAPSYCASPVFSEYRVSSPDLGARMLSAPVSPLPFRQREAALEEFAPLNMAFPYYRLCDQKWELVWPSAGGETSEERPKTQTKSHPSSLLVFPYYSVRERSPSPAPVKMAPPPPSRMVFPYYKVPDMAWKHVWPYQAQAEKQDTVAAKYPYLNLYPAVYPAFDLYPSTVNIKPTNTDKEASVVLLGSYAAFNLYPAVYPHFEIYPMKARTELAAGSSAVTTAKPVVQVQLTRHYPFFNLYPAVYPWSLEKIYPNVQMEVIAKNVVTKLSAMYPAFDIYPAVYPHNMRSLYPVIPTKRETKHSVHSGADYPHFDICKAKVVVTSTTISKKGRPQVQMKLASQYPVFDLYPAVYPNSLRSIYPVQKSDQISSSVCLPSVYPNLVVYPAVYPWNMECIYPPTGRIASKVAAVQTQGVKSISTTLTVCYPHFDIYPAVYPYSMRRIYPSAVPTVAGSRAISVSLSAAYPAFDLYPAVYPHNLGRIYPVRGSSNKQCDMRCKVNADTGGLEFVLCIYTCPYADVDPFLMLHPELADGYSTGSEVQRAANIEAVRYPALNIYPAVYPFFDIYPEAAGGTSVTQRALKITLCDARYPALKIYPAVYPSFCLYPEVSCETSLSMKQEIHVNLTEMRYPTLDIYPAVYPHFVLYPTVSGALSRNLQDGPVLIEMTSRYPVLNLYPAVYPNFSIYPRVWSSAVPGMPRKQPVPAIAELPLYASQRNARLTHAQLHDLVFEGSSEEHTCDEEELWEMVTPSVQTVASPLPSSLAPLPVRAAVATHPQYTSRRQPRYTHAQLHEQVFSLISQAEATDKVTPLPQHPDHSGMVRSRSRTGSIANRPIPPPKPTDPSMFKPPPPPPRSSSLLHAAANPRLSLAAAGSSARPTSVMGLPSHPAAMRRVSATPIGPRPASSASPTLRTLPEPGRERPSASPPRRIAPKDSLETMRESSRPMSRINVDIRRNAHAPRSSIETLPPGLPELHSPELGRANTMPTSRTGRSERRMSIVMEKARAYDLSNPATKGTQEDDPVRITMTALSRFPTPPRPSLPIGNTPSVRPVSKLDRSKFPFV